MAESDNSLVTQVRVLETKLTILIDDYKRGRESNEQHLSKIYREIRKVPAQISGCKDQIEGDIEELEKEIEDLYMTKPEGALMEQRLSSNIKSLKIWIVSTVGGFTAAGAFLIWFLELGVKT